MTRKHLVGQHVQQQLEYLSTNCTNPIQIGRAIKVRTQETRTAAAIHPEPFKPYSKDTLNSDTPKTAKNVTMEPITEMIKVTQVCLYEALMLLLSHDMEQFVVDSLFCTAGPNVQVPKHGVSTTGGQLKQALHAFLKPRVDHNTQQA